MHTGRGSYLAKFKICKIASIKFDALFKHPNFVKIEVRDFKVICSFCINDYSF